MMQEVMTTGDIRVAKLQSNHHHQQTDSQLFTGWMPFVSPNQQCQSTEGSIRTPNCTVTFLHLEKLGIIGSSTDTWRICFLK